MEGCRDAEEERRRAVWRNKKSRKMETKKSKKKKGREARRAVRMNLVGGQAWEK